jgi:hypothetical protein
MNLTEAFLKTIIYFDVFSYPVTLKELLDYTGLGDDRYDEAGRVMDVLVEMGLVKCKGGFYFLGDADKIERRKKGNQKAQERMPTAIRYSRIISWFPFVRGVLLSGSISKGYMAQSDDIDYFIVVENGRLWITRTFLTLFKKVFLLNSYRNFCINYFVGTDNLYIADHNLFTATELVFLVPVYNRDMYYRLLSENSWARRYYPIYNQTGPKTFDGDNLLKIVFEKLLSLRIFDRLEEHLMQTSKTYVRRKFSDLDDDTFRKSFLFRQDEIRYFPNRQQFRILDAYKKSLCQFEMENNIEISALNLSLKPG